MRQFSKSEYGKAIEALQLGREQLTPDGDSCSICNGNDHQAWECTFNPLRAMEFESEIRTIVANFS